ncbi:MAG: ABC transporter permease [Candidatus Yanofskybacteria bacterium]|nr:ABC transporter permease [Candidatus Yanofskybacteria bacterium]
MTLRNTFKTALVGLTTHKSRSILTILGIVIGITAIMLVMSLSQGATDLILSQIQGLGSQTIIVRAGREPSGPSDFASIFTTSLKDREVTAIKNPALVRGVVAVAPNVIGSGTALYGSETKNASLLGTTPDILQALEIYPKYGAFFNDGDVSGRSSVAVLGSEVKKELFGESDAVGETIKFYDRNFKVVGVFDDIGQIGAFDIDSNIIIPVTTANQYLLGASHYTVIMVRVESEAVVEKSADDIRQTLRELHNITDPDKDDFLVATQADLAERVGTITGVLSALLLSVAAISLIVGGIGIMNIMLVSVTERTREIGLRKAVGATTGDILKQFLFESVILTSTGGVIGIALGSLLSLVMSIVLTQFLEIDWGFAFPIMGALLGFGVSALIGLIFGIYPARQASKKSPIEALRYE